jgi:hypothetical protein
MQVSFPEKKILVCYFHFQGTSITGNKQIQSGGDYYAVRWEDNTGVSVVQHSAIRKPPDIIQLFEHRVVERDDYYRNGQIILKGKKMECFIFDNRRYAENSFNLFFFERSPLVFIVGSKSDCEILRHTIEKISSNAHTNGKLK